MNYLKAWEALHRLQEAQDALRSFYAEKYASEAKQAAAKTLRRKITKEEMATSLSTAVFDHRMRTITYSFHSRDTDEAVITTLVSFLVPPTPTTPTHTSDIPEQYQEN